jgi:hypothetical protein
MIGCAREKEIAELLRNGHWPQACPSELRAHVAACRTCSDLVLVTETFRAERLHAMPPRLESAGAIWWRAQLRRRNDAIERIGRPILGAQIFALGIALVVGLGIVGWELRRGFNIALWLAEILHTLHLSALLPTSAPTFEGNLWLLVPLLATLALVSGVIVYLASEKQ